MPLAKEHCTKYSWNRRNLTVGDLPGRIYCIVHQATLGGKMLGISSRPRWTPKYTASAVQLRFLAAAEVVACIGSPFLKSGLSTCGARNADGITYVQRGGLGFHVHVYY